MYGRIHLLRWLWWLWLSSLAYQIISVTNHYHQRHSSILLNICYAQNNCTFALSSRLQWLHGHFCNSTIVWQGVLSWTNHIWILIWNFGNNSLPAFHNMTWQSFEFNGKQIQLQCIQFANNFERQGWDKVEQ